MDQDDKKSEKEVKDSLTEKEILDILTKELNKDEELDFLN
jgi:hypothetical protein